jgi:hypothetical protein
MLALWLMRYGTETDSSVRPAEFEAAIWSGRLNCETQRVTNPPGPEAEACVPARELPVRQ